jgi:hypothetical protein
MKKFYFGAAILAFCCAVGGTGFAADTAANGPAEITLQTAVNAQKTPQPAFFPHARHQGLTECAVCHHSKGADGKKVTYVKGQKIEKCEACHNDKSGMPEKLANLKRAAHKLCVECHLESLPELIKCGVCHTKK